MSKKSIKSIFNTGNNVAVIESLENVCLQIMNSLEQGKKPVIKSIKESSDNAIYDSKKGYFVPGDKQISIELNVSSIKKMTRMLFVGKILINLLRTGSVATLREVYYISKGQMKGNDKLKPLNFDDQSECDSIISELAAFALSWREDWNIVANEKSGLTYSKALIVTETLPDGSKATVDLGNMGTAPYIPKNRPQDLELKIKKGMKIDFVIAIESEGSASSLVANKFLERNNAIIVALGGQPSMGTRGWLKKIQDQLKIPIYLYSDMDPYSSIIARSVKSGSFNSLLRAKNFSAPDVRWLGVLPEDIKKYDLDYYNINEKDPSEARALKRAKDQLTNDPFFKDKKNKKYRDVVEWILKNKIRCEQQSALGYKTNDPEINGMEFIILDKIKRGSWI